MTEVQPPTIVEGATTGDVEDELSQAPRAAEDRKAAAALSSLDARDDESNVKDVDQEAVRQAISRLQVNGTGTESKKSVNTTEVKKAVKVDATDVTLVMEQLDMTKLKATELLKGANGDVIKAFRTYVTSMV